jgi:hypothetical protein
MSGVWEWLFGASSDAPRLASFSGREGLATLHVASDTLLAMSFFALAFSIAWFSRCRTESCPQAAIAGAPVRRICAALRRRLGH